jgi:hypothetical protein
MWGIPGPNPDPILEGKYARPRSFRDMAGAFVLGVMGFVLLLGGAALAVDLVR